MAFGSWRCVRGIPELTYVQYPTVVSLREREQHRPHLDAPGNVELFQRSSSIFPLLGERVRVREIAANSRQ